MRRSMFVTLVIVAVLLSGCQNLGFGKKDAPKQGAFIGGTKGVEVGFAQDQPPASVLDNNQEQFFITLLLKNSGEFTVPRNKIIASLSGIERSSFGLQSLNVKNDFELFGAYKESEFTVPGGEDLLEFGEASFKPDLPADVSYTLRADICYAYKTRAVTKICLKKNVLGRNVLGEVCQVTNNNLQVENSGAPMHVIVARETTVGTNKARISFKIQNKDIGAVFAPETFTDACIGHENEKDQLKVTVINPENHFTVECPQFGNSNSGVIKLVNKEKEVSCTISTAGLQESTFQDVLLFELDYMYRQGITVPIRVSNAV